MAQKAKRGRSLARRRGRVIIVVVAVVLALAFFGARLFRVYQPRAGNPSGEASLKPVDSIHYQSANNHIHGLGYDSENRSLFIATHYGLFIWREDQLFQLGKSRDDYMGFSLHPADPDIMYSSGHPSGGGNMGVLKSADGGASFERIFRGLGGETVDFHSMTISPANPRVLYGWFQGKIYRTKDGGGSWTLAAGRGLPPRGLCFGAPCLAADSRDARVLYAGTPDGLLVSRDFGESWNVVNREGAFAGIGVEPKDPHGLFAFTERSGLAYSADGGKSWRPTNGGMRLRSGEFVFAFAFDGENSKHVFAATPEQVFRSSDRGQSWEKVL